MSTSGLLAIDVGTSRVKLGWFPDFAACDSEKPSQLPIAAPRLPEPAETIAIQHRGVSDKDFIENAVEWLFQFRELDIRISLASVDKKATERIMGTLRDTILYASRTELKVADLPLELDVSEPTLVGIDRVLAAVAVNRIRVINTPAIVVSLGTACTVNLISADGMFQGGAILPGFAMSSQALHLGTTMLPLVSPESLMLPSNAVGKNTAEAIAAGVYWGMVGAIEKLIAEQSRSSDKPPQLFLTGGNAPLVADALEADGYAARVMPHLVLSGIAIACEGQS